MEVDSWVVMLIIFAEIWIKPATDAITDNGSDIFIFVSGELVVEVNLLTNCLNEKGS